MGIIGLSNGLNVFQENFHDLITSCGRNYFTNAIGLKVWTQNLSNVEVQCPI